MSTAAILLITYSAYKIAGLSAGVLFGYFGYKLFRRGIWGHAGTLQASYKDNKLLLKGAAPGTFFVVLGAIIIGVALFEGYDLYYRVGTETIGHRPSPP
jgi:hypothetical protein